jgi:hypothetical protein
MSSRRQPTKGDPPAWVLGKGLTTPRLKKNSLLRNVTQGLGRVWSLVNTEMNLRVM